MKMKKIITLFLFLSVILPLSAQSGERSLNRRYFNAVRDSLIGDMLTRQRAMQHYAQNTLVNLPNDEKLYDESYISLTADLDDHSGTADEGIFDLVYRLSYNCKHIEGYTDDYPLGAYAVDSSNSCRAICNLTKHFLENDLRDYITAGKEVEITIFSSADGTEFTTKIPYDGSYGDFRYCPVTFNGENLRVSVDRTMGIRNNCQLVYIRAQAVRNWLEENIPILRQTSNNYRYVTQSYSDSANIHYYRRSSIEIRVLNVAHEAVERSLAEMRMDDYVDYNIHRTNIKNNDAYVLIIANEDYGNGLIPDVPFALNDGEIFRQYCISSLGIPERQVKILKNASRETILSEGIHWLTDLSQAVAVKNGDELIPLANFFIYYTGHGFSNADDQAFLVPTGINTDDIDALNIGKKKGCRLFGKKDKKEVADSNLYDIVLSSKESSRLSRQLFSLDDLCGMFKNHPVKNLTVIVDASFNGYSRDGKPIFRTIHKIDNKKKKRKASMRSDAVVLLAADFDRTAYSFNNQQHGFLTYFLLKELKLQQDNIFSMTYQDVFESVARKLNKESALQNRWQEASGIAGGRYKDSWHYMRIK